MIEIQNLAENNFDKTQRKLQAVLWYLLILRHFLEAARFTFRTDHSALLWII